MTKRIITQANGCRMLMKVAQTIQELVTQTNPSNKLQIAYGVDASHEKYQSPNNEEHSRDNYGAYLNINADFAMKYNFGFRVGNEDPNALRFGLESGPSFLNVGNSYRRSYTL